MPLETALRLIVIGQELLIAAVFVSGGGGRDARISGALLMLSIVGYLHMSDAGLRDAVPLTLLTSFLALSVPYCLWLFARAVFEAPWPRPWLISLPVLVGVIVWGIYVSGDAVSPRWANFAGIVMHVVALGIVSHAVWLTARGRHDDLIEKRRTFRLFFVAVVSLQVAAVLVAELVLAGTTPPLWLDRLNIVVIAVLTVGLAIPVLRLDPDFFVVEADRDPQFAAADANTGSAAERVFARKLLNLMDDGYYRETGLTIRMLAEKLNYPEHQLRRLINGHLRFRNFSAFLNSYRIDEARKKLVDPDRARIPVLTIALDLGYASVGPFNRAFKAVTGMTPTAYRQQHLQPLDADSE